MTAKLTEFELRSVMRPLLVVWGALLAMTVLLCAVLAVTGLNSYENMIHSGKVLNLISGLVNTISWIVYVALFVSVVVLTIAIVILRFYRGLLGDEGYLMHTLPVKEWELITAKGAAAALTVIGSILAAGISLLLIGITRDFSAVAEGFQEFGKAIAKDPWILILIIEGIIIGILTILKSIYQIYASVSIGQLADRHRVLASLGAYIGITFILSTLAGILILIGTVTGAGEWIAYYFDGIENGFAASQVMVFLIFLGTAIQLAAFHVVTERLLTKHLNLL